MTETELTETDPPGLATVEGDVRRFITENFPLGGSGAELARGDSLLEVGVIDSVGVLELIEHLESTYGFSIPDADVLPENLDSIDAIAGYVARRLADSSHAGG